MLPEIFVTTHDAARLSRVLEIFRDPFYAPLTNFLVDELRRATAVAPRAVPRDVVTMNARVWYPVGRRERAVRGHSGVAWAACWAGSRC